uniref:Uncharacterized protein n=1 Tax=Tetraselmis sp. GSL018 TaxID=582737 RepID=A0A061QXD7_9CHLO
MERGQSMRGWRERGEDSEGGKGEEWEKEDESEGQEDRT